MFPFTVDESDLKWAVENIKKTVEHQAALIQALEFRVDECRCVTNHCITCRRDLMLLDEAKAHAH